MSLCLATAFTDTRPPDPTFVTPVDMSRFSFMRKPVAIYRRKPLFGTDVFRGEVTVVPAPGGSGKSTWVSACAVSCATGMTLLHDPPHKKLSVLFINAEDSQSEAQMRLEAVLLHHQIPQSAVGNDLHVIGADDARELILTEANPATRREQLRLSGFAAIRKYAEACAADVIFLDPLVVLVPVGQLDNGLMSSVMSELRRIASDLKCGIVLVSHTRKGASVATDGADANSGAAAITNRARVVVGVSPVPEEDAAVHGIFPGEAWRYRYIHNVKANLAPIRGRRLVEFVSVGMGNSTSEYPTEDFVAVAIPYLPAQGTSTWITSQLQRDILVTIARGLSFPQGPQHFSPAPGRSHRSFLTACTATLTVHLPGRTSQALQAAAKTVMRDLTKRGWIDAVAVTIPKASGGTNPAKGLIVRWGQTPWANDPRPGAFAV